MTRCRVRDEVELDSREALELYTSRLRTKNPRRNSNAHKNINWRVGLDEVAANVVAIGAGQRVVAADSLRVVIRDAVVPC